MPYSFRFFPDEGLNHRHEADGLLKEAQELTRFLPGGLFPGPNLLAEIDAGHSEEREDDERKQCELQIEHHQHYDYPYGHDHVGDYADNPGGNQTLDLRYVTVQALYNVSG